jgi:hypothetical protein
VEHHLEKVLYSELDFALLALGSRPLVLAWQSLKQEPPVLAQKLLEQLV